MSRGTRFKPKLTAGLPRRSPTSASRLLGYGRVLLSIVLLVAAVSLATTIAVHKVGFLLRTEFFIEDVERAIYTPNEPQQPDIVIVSIDDSTLEGFAYSSPIDRGFLSDLIEWIAAQSPRATGIDILFDQPTEPAKDARLHQLLTTLKTPLVISYINDPGVETAAQQSHLDQFVPPAMRGTANLAEDPFDTVRYIQAGRTGPDGKLIPSFPRRLAARLGVQPPPGLTEIVWRGSPDADSEPFKIYPAQLVRHLNPAFFRDKVVLIGSNFAMTDRHRTPFAAVYEGARGALPGVVIQAHALAQLLERRLPDRPPVTVNFAITCLLALIGTLTGRIERAFVYTVLCDVAVVAGFWIIAFLLFHHYRVLIGLLPPSFAMLATSWITDSLSGQEARRQREFIRNSFSQYVPATVVRELIQRPERLSLQGERRELSMIFTDVSNFTTLSEQLSAQELGVLLNRYLTVVCDVLFEHEGTVLKFMGDGTFAIFNAPTDQPDHAERAIRCALQLDRVAQAFAAEQSAAGVPFGSTRIGIHTGEASVGNFGSQSRKEYGAMGDAVNIAARLEGINKLFGTRICASGATVAGCSTIAFRPLAEVVLKGKSIPIAVFEPLQYAVASADFIAAYSEAYRALARDAPTAGTLFAGLAKAYPRDKTTRLHRDRLARGESGVVIASEEEGKVSASKAVAEADGPKTAIEV